MKIKLLSDLHFEFYQDKGKEFINNLDTEADVCILAGDICHASSIVEVMSRFCEKYKNVIYVTGNHEYYLSERGKVNKALEKAKAYNSNLSVLQRDSVTIDGQRFIGATLWFKYDAEVEKRSYWLNDFKVIKNFRTWIAQENHNDVEFLCRNVQAGDVVVTHHLPSHRCVHPRYAGSPFNCFFVCDLEPTILEKKPAIWCSGHTHSSFDFNLGETRMVCNPFGYVEREENPEFNSGLALTT